MFRRLLDVRQRDEPGHLRSWLAPLVGRDLACWCPLDQPCHADVLLELANSSASGPPFTRRAAPPDAPVGEGRAG